MSRFWPFRRGWQTATSQRLIFSSRAMDRSLLQSRSEYSRTSSPAPFRVSTAAARLDRLDEYLVSISQRVSRQRPQLEGGGGIGQHCRSIASSSTVSLSRRIDLQTPLPCCMQLKTTSWQPRGHNRMQALEHSGDGCLAYFACRQDVLHAQYSKAHAL